MADITVLGVALQEETPASKKLKNGLWRMVNLRGARPKGHPIISRSQRGKVILAEKQVWVELHTDELWQIIQLVPHQHKGPRHHAVMMKRYRKAGRFTYPFSENTLRTTMAVWDDRFRDRIGFIDTLVKGGRAEGSEVTKSGVQSFFGLDKYGNRID